MYKVTWAHREYWGKCATHRSLQTKRGERINHNAKRAGEVNKVSQRVTELILC